MLTTANPEWDRLFRLWRQHGMDVPDTVRHGSATVMFEGYPIAGFNYRMTDIQAAVGREQLKRLPTIVARRRTLADRYDRLLDGMPGLVVPREPAWARSNWQSYCVRLPAEVDQVAVMQSMLDDGIATRRGIMCAHMEAAYADKPRRFALPHSESARDGCLLLPLFPQMTDAEQEQVAASLAEAVAVPVERPVRRRASLVTQGAMHA